MHRLVIAASVLALTGTACAPLDPADRTDDASEALRARAGTTWIISRVIFPEVSWDADGPVSPGFDLDGLDSGDGRLDAEASCEEYGADFDSELAPELGGVDNAGGAIIAAGESIGDFTFEGALDAAMAEGRVRWALRIGELEEPSDGTIPLELFALVDPVEIGPSGRPLAAQTLRARRLAAARGSARGSVAVADLEPVVLGVDGAVPLLPFEDFELAALGVRAQPAPDALYGNLGGSFSVEALVDATVREAPHVSAASARVAFSGAADLVPSPDDPTRCERVSVGFAFEAVPVTLIVD